MEPIDTLINQTHFPTRQIFPYDPISVISSLRAKNKPKTYPHHANVALAKTKNKITLEEVKLVLPRMIKEPKQELEMWMEVDMINAPSVSSFSEMIEPSTKILPNEIPNQCQGQKTYSLDTSKKK